MKILATKPSTQDSSQQKRQRKNVHIAQGPSLKLRRSLSCGESHLAVGGLRITQGALLKLRQSLSNGESQSTGLTGSVMLQRKSDCACGGGCPRCQEEAVLLPNLSVAHELVQTAQQRASNVLFRSPGPGSLPTSAQRQLLQDIAAKIQQINSALMNGYAWHGESYQNGIIEIGLFGMRFPVAQRNFHLLTLRRYLTELRSRVRAGNVPDPSTHPGGARGYITHPFQLQWLVSHYLEALGVPDPNFDMFIHYTEFRPITTTVMPRVSGVISPLNLGEYIVVPDPVNRPTEVERLDPFRRQSGIILDLWVEAGVYFYYYRGEKHYLPEFQRR